MQLLMLVVVKTKSYNSMAGLMLCAKMNYSFFVFCSEYVSPAFSVDDKGSFRLC